MYQVNKGESGCVDTALPPTAAQVSGAGVLRCGSVEVLNIEMSGSGKFLTSYIVHLNPSFKKIIEFVRVHVDVS